MKESLLAYLFATDMRGVSGFYVESWFWNIQLCPQFAGFASKILLRANALHLRATTYLARCSSLWQQSRPCMMASFPANSTKGWRDVTSGNSPGRQLQVPFTSKSFLKCFHMYDCEIFFIRHFPSSFNPTTSVFLFHISANPSVGENFPSIASRTLAQTFPQKKNFRQTIDWG